MSALACASFVVAACSGDDDEPDTSDAPEITSGGTEEESPDTTAGGEAPGTTAGEESPDTTTDGTTETTDGGGEGEGAVGEVGGSACGEPHGPYDEAEAAGEVRIAWNDPLLSFNSATTRGNAVANNNPLFLMNAGDFSYYDADLNLINNDQFGTCTIDSLDPLTVTYTIADGVTWTDGTPVDATDLFLTWAATGTQFQDAETVNTPDGQTVAADADGNAIINGPDGPLDPESEEYAAAFDPEGATGAELLPGFTYEETTGVAFDASSESLELVTQFPEMSEDGQSITITWDSYYVDFAAEGGGLTTSVPAHVTAQQALGIEDPMEAKAALVDAFQRMYDDPADNADVKSISETYNTGFDATSLPDEPGLYNSFGPYNLTGFTEDGEMTFEARDDYTWGPQPQVQTVVYSIIGDPVAAVQAMANEEVDIIAPQATADLLTQLEGVADRGIVTVTGDAATYEHVDLVFDNGGPFDPATYGGDEATALAVRQAFLHSIPRQEIIDRLIAPLNPDATVRDSFNQVPGSPNYDDTIANNGSAEYAETDIELATQLLTEAGVDTTTPIDVRMLFAADNPRRAEEYNLIRDSAAQAGFNVIDGNSPTWGQDLDNNSVYDASLFGWQTTAVAVADSEANFVTGGLNNLGHYPADGAVDGLYEQLKGTTDADEQQSLLVEIESNLFADAFGIPLFQHPGLTAYNSTYVENIGSIAIAPTVLYNFWEWTPAS